MVMMVAGITSMLPPGPVLILCMCWGEEWKEGREEKLIKQINKLNKNMYVKDTGWYNLFS